MANSHPFPSTTRDSRWRSRAAALLLLASPVSPSPADEPATRTVLDAIGKLESKSDPKCHATASRLENFLYGTPVGLEARLLKNELITGFVGELLQEKTPGRFETGSGENGDTVLRFANGQTVTITARDLRQYGSVAFSLRALLATATAGAPKPAPTSLDADRVAEIKRAADLASVALLQVADQGARADDEREISAEHMRAAWDALFGDPPPVANPAAVDGQPLLRSIIAQKRASYAAYNEIANSLFVRNLQVYFARLSWPKTPERAKAFRGMFTEATIAFAADLYREAARAGGRPVREAQVAAAAQRFLPHRVNEYEDVVFFPKLQGAGSITIEAYDFDAFRDSGIHWAYLGEALDDLAAEGLPDADPFAAELLAEQVAQFGVLLLRAVGHEGEARGEERVSVDLLQAAMVTIQKRIREHAAAPEPKPAAAAIRSAAGASPETASGQFEDVTPSSGVAFMHRSSDWLNRQLRSYLSTGAETGTITIPPAFGGSGVAAEDIDGDGHTDLLLLGGLGNRLYLGRGDGRFEDITEKSGILYRRDRDGTPGEPRQPLVADFDNDGHQDLLITYVDDPHRLYRGRGDGTFTDVTGAAGLGGEGLVGGPATAFDFDGDGLLDLYISYFGNYLKGVLPTLKRFNDNGSPNRLFRNLGDMRFEDVTARAKVGDTGWGQAALHTDFDGDGRQDLISGNDFGTNRYYRNLGDGRFAEVASALGTGKPSYTMSLAVADLNADLRPDIYVSNIVTMNKDEKYVLPGADTRMKFDLQKLANLRVVEANDLFLSSGDGTYELSTAVERGYSATGWAWDADFFDADLDGDDDLYVLNGMNEFNIYGSRNPYFMDPDSGEAKEIYVPVAPSEPNVFFENSGGKLRKPEAPSGLEFDGNSRSAAFLDWDADGDLDICVNGFNEPARLFENQAGGNWIKITLVGDPGAKVNRDAIGARVLLRLPGNRTVWREVQSTTGYMSVHPKTIHAGLGEANAATVEVRWPNGVTEKLGQLAANQSHTVRYKEPGRLAP